MSLSLRVVHFNSYTFFSKDAFKIGEHAVSAISSHHHKHQQQRREVELEERSPFGLFTIALVETITQEFSPLTCLHFLSPVKTSLRLASPL